MSVFIRTVILKYSGYKRKRLFLNQQFISFVVNKFVTFKDELIALDMTLKGICSVRHDNRKVFSSKGSRTKYFDRFFIVQ